MQEINDGRPRYGRGTRSFLDDFERIQKLVAHFLRIVLRHDVSATGRFDGGATQWS